MNEEVILKDRYNPSSITQEKKNISSKTHDLFSQEYVEWIRKKSTTSEVYIDLCNLLYIVRCNLAHGDKTPYGPDLEKSKKDKTFFEIVLPILKLIVEFYFEQPNKRLVVYGCLNDLGLIDNKYRIEKGYVEGEFIQDKHYKYYIPIVNGNKCEVDLYCSENTFEFSRLDKIQGIKYKRILVPVLLDRGFQISNIYCQC